MAKLEYFFPSQYGAGIPPREHSERLNDVLLKGGPGPDDSFSPADAHPPVYLSGHPYNETPRNGIARSRV